MNDEQKHRQEIEQLVNERFAVLFPPGSDGPDMGFNIGDLYEWAEVELVERNAPEPEIDMPDMPECHWCGEELAEGEVYHSKVLGLNICKWCHSEQER